MNSVPKFFAAPLFAGLLVSIALETVARAADPPIVFNRDIRPILSDKCFACHGFDSKKREADLRLDIAAGALADHDGTRAIVPGKPDESAVWERINSTDKDEMMPPPKTNKTLSDAEKALLKRWIEEGATYQDHWSFEVPTKPEPPRVEGTIANPIDAFLSARLKAEGLDFSPEAPRETLIRRVAFALTGLPPTLAEIDEFMADKSPEAYEKMVDRYLASPRYGEEMARHWLDVARYGDTHGLHLDNERQTWGYRDYVIRAFNANKPFDQFTIEQIAGDLLPNATNEQLTATGYSRCNVTTSEGGSINEELIYRYAVDRTATLVQTWMGLTGGCAVCHDHKFDPLTTKEFYSLYAFFNSAADPGFDGNSLLTQPTVKMVTPEMEAQRADVLAQVAARQQELDAQAAAFAYVDPATVPAAESVAETEFIWFEDDFPAGARVNGSPGQPTQFVTASEGKVHSGQRALRRSEPGLGQDYYDSGAPPLLVPGGAEFFVWVYLEPDNLPKSLMVQFNKGGWSHRAIWGDYEAIQWGAANTNERVAMGPLPAAGEWVRLAFPLERVGLKAGDQINGFALTQFAGTVYWDKVGVVGRSAPSADPNLSLSAWRKQAAGKDTPGASPEVNELLKKGPDQSLAPEQEAKVRAHFIEHVFVNSKPEFAQRVAAIAELRKKGEELGNSAPSTFIFRDTSKPRDSFVMMRGQYDKPGDKVEPSTPAFLPALKKDSPDARPSRLDLAHWLVQPEHPLTARVTVNRYWQQFFGIGLVKTSGDFGSQGQAPSHPELLDWLAVSFRETGWNVKDLVRLMVMSRAFRQQTRVSPELLARDPENRLLARGPRFRLDAEQIRDNVLFVSGLMDFTMGGKGVNPYQPPNIWEPVGFAGSNTRFYKQDSGSALYRRSIYTFIKRTAPHPFLTNFDGPNREQFCTRRERSNTPLQALQLMNDIQHFEAARVLAERLAAEGGATPAERIARCYRLVLSRAPAPEETAIAEKQLATHLALFQQDEPAAKQVIDQGATKAKANVPPAELAALTMMASMVLNLDETVNRN